MTKKIGSISSIELPGVRRTNILMLGLPSLRYVGTLRSLRENYGWKAWKGRAD